MKVGQCEHTFRIYLHDDNNSSSGRVYLAPEQACSLLSDEFKKDLSEAIGKVIERRRAAQMEMVKEKKRELEELNTAIAFRQPWPAGS